YRTILEWIRNGARNDTASAPTLVGLDVLPSELGIVGAERSFRFLVRARWSAGRDEDVTELAPPGPGDPATARIDGNRLVSGSRGEAVLLARFGTLAATCRVLVLPEGPRPTWTAPPAANAIDREIFAKLEKLGLPPAPRCSDETFLRR